MILSTPIYLQWPCHAVTQGHSQGTITLKQGQFGKQPTMKLLYLVMMCEDIVTIILLHVTSCQNIATTNSSVPDSWWSMWQSRRWCDTWDPDHGLEGPPHSLFRPECLFASRLVLGPDKRPFPSDTFSGHKNRQQCKPFFWSLYCYGQRGAEKEMHNYRPGRDEIEFIAPQPHTLLLLLPDLIPLSGKSFQSRYA